MFGGDQWSSKLPHDLKVMGSSPVAVVSLSSWDLLMVSRHKNGMKHKFTVGRFKYVSLRLCRKPKQ